jgi:hypothetical protein
VKFEGNLINSFLWLRRSQEASYQNRQIPDDAFCGQTPCRIHQNPLDIFLYGFTIWNPLNFPFFPVFHLREFQSNSYKRS